MPSVAMIMNRIAATAFPGLPGRLDGREALDVIGKDQCPSSPTSRGTWAAPK